MSRRSFLPLVVAATLGVVLVAHLRSGVWAQETYARLKLFTEVVQDIETEYVTEVPPTQLVHGALVGMLSSLDGESELIEPPRATEEKEKADVGLVIIRRKASFAVLAPLDGTPAQRAGVMAGDRILKIDGVDATTMERSEAVTRLHGPADTTVTVTLMRPGWTEAKDFRLTRERRWGPTVSARDLDDGVIYLRVHRFADSTGQELAAALSALGDRGLVLDLRNEPDGSATDAVDLVQRFLEPGQLITYRTGRGGEHRHELRASSSPPPHLDAPVAVLVNEGSAAAAEIAAGALQDWRRAVIIGTRTAGEASVQSSFRLSDGSTVRITTDRYFTPQGHMIEGQGIVPDIEVAATPSTDVQLARAVEVLKIARVIQRRDVRPDTTSR